MTADEVAKDMVDAALQVHRALGPRLLESPYQAGRAYELRRRQPTEHYVVVMSPTLG
jgi:PD-(D/E)XK nuclease superfamily